MNGVKKHAAQSLNLFGASALLSLSSIPVGSIQVIAGSGLFLLGMGCNAVAASLMVVQRSDQMEKISARTQFLSSVSAVSMGGAALSISSFVGIRDIVMAAPVSFSSMAAGFAMATGMVSFYGGLHSLRHPHGGQDVQKQDFSAPSPDNG